MRQLPERGAYELNSSFPSPCFLLGAFISKRLCRFRNGRRCQFQARSRPRDRTQRFRLSRHARREPELVAVRASGFRVNVRSFSPIITPPFSRFRVQNRRHWHLNREIFGALASKGAGYTRIARRINSLLNNHFTDKSMRPQNPVKVHDNVDSRPRNCGVDRLGSRQIVQFTRCWTGTTGQSPFRNISCVRGAVLAAQAIKARFAVLGEHCADGANRLERRLHIARYRECSGVRCYESDREFA